MARTREYRDLGILVLEIPGLQCRTRLLAQRWALRPLNPFFPESLHVWCVRSNEDTPSFLSSFPSSLPHCTSNLGLGLGGWAECEV